MRDEWKRVSVSDVAQLNPEVVSRTNPPAEIRYIDISAVSATGVSADLIRTLPWEDAPSRAQRVVRAGDIIISTVRPYLRARALITPELDGCVASTGFCVVRATSVLPEFLEAATRTEDFYAHLEARQTGTSYPAVRAADIGGATVAVPASLEQHRIADVLGQLKKHGVLLDDLISASRQLRHGLCERLHDEARARSSASVRLGDIADVVSGASWSREDERTEADATTVGAIRVANMQRDRLDLSDLRLLVPSGEAERKRASYPSVMLVRTNTSERVGNAQFVPESADGLVYSSFLILVKPHKAEDTELIGRFLQAPQCQSEMTAKASGSTAGLKNVPVTWLRDLQVPQLTDRDRLELLAPIAAAELTLSALGRKRVAHHQLESSLLSTLLSGAHEIPASYDRLLPENGAGVDLEPIKV